MFLLERKLARNILRSTFLLIASLVFQLVQADPITLTDAQLDRISAGYVNLEVSGRASAAGPNAVAKFSSNVEQTISEAQADNYIYTTTTGSADAYAKGRKASTEVGFFVETNEEVLSFDVMYSKNSSAETSKNRKKGNKGKKNKKSRNSKNKYKASKSKHKNRKSSNKKGNNRVTRERQQLTVTIQTRQSIN